jgi:hypothetical protein
MPLSVTASMLPDSAGAAASFLSSRYSRLQRIEINHGSINCGEVRSSVLRR